MTQAHFEVSEHGGINPEKESPKFFAKHFSAYHFARSSATGKVLEIGFGDGYGSSFLALSAQEVKAIDLFDVNVTAAAIKYPRSNLQFVKMDATRMDWKDNAFDAVVSFQVIEHIPQSLLGVFIHEIKRVTRDGGKAFLSTLNLKKNQKPGKPYEKSPHHDKEFTAREFEEFLKPFFKEVSIYGLYPSAKHAFFERLKKAGILNFLPEPANPVSRYYQRIGVEDFQWLQKTCLDESVDLMAVCRN